MQPSHLISSRTIDKTDAANGVRRHRSVDHLASVSALTAGPTEFRREACQSHRNAFDSFRTESHRGFVQWALAVLLLLSLPGTGFAQAVPGYRGGKILPGTIGTATVEPSGTIVLQLRTQEDNGTIAEGLLRYSPGDPGYEMVARHIGEIPPGKTVLVRPFPEQGRTRKSPDK